MAEISSAAVALIVVFIFVLLGIAAELTYVLWYRRKFRRGPLFAAGDQEASPAGDAFGTPDSKELLLYHVLSRGHQSRSERAPPTGEPLYSVTAAIGFAWPGSDSPYYSQARPSPSPPWHGGVFYGGFHGAPIAEKEKEEGFSPGKVWEEEQKPAAAVKKEQKPPLAVKKEQKPPPAVKKEQKPPLAVKKEQKAAPPQRKEEEEEMVAEEEGKEEVVEEEEEEKSGFEFSQMETSTPSTPFYTPTPSPPRVSARDWDLGRYLAELDDEVLSPPAERLLRRPKIPK